MPTRRQDDRSPGDARRPYSDQGGPAGRHAQTHDVRREELTRPKGPEGKDEFAADIAPAEPEEQVGGHVEESFQAAQDKGLQARLHMLDAEQLKQLPVLQEGADLEQGGTYIDLNDRDRGPFKAIGGRRAARDNRYVAKRDVDYELWNRLVGRDEDPEVQRPDLSG